MGIFVAIWERNIVDILQPELMHLIDERCVA